MFWRKRRGTRAAGAEGSGAADWHATLSLFQSSGDAELLISGVHENLPAVRFHDTTLERTAAALDWLAVSEEIGTKVRLDGWFRVRV